MSTLFFGFLLHTAHKVIGDWERIVSGVGRSLIDVLASCGPHQVANADYLNWDPS